MNLAEYLVVNRIGKSEFGRRLSKRLNGEPVPPQSVHRWTRPMNAEHYNVPRAEVVEAIELETHGAVEPNDWYRRPRKGRSSQCSIEAARKAAAVVRRRRERERAAAS